MVFTFRIIIDMQKSRPQDEGKAKVKEMVEQFKKNCMKKITTKSLDPAEFKQGIHTPCNDALYFVVQLVSLICYH